MQDKLTEIHEWAAPLLAKLTPEQRRKISLQIGRKLAASQRKRIAKQQNPDGSPFTPRKEQSAARSRRGSIRQQAMFMKIRQAKYLKTEATPEGLVVGFIGQIARIALVHQLGLRDRPSKKAPEVQYPKRELLGFSDQDRAMVMDELLTHLTGESRA